jgi:transposase
MIQHQIKLRPNVKLEAALDEWLWMLTGVFNFAVRKIQLDAKDGIYYTPNGFQNLLAGHGRKIGIPSHTVQGVLATVHAAWQRCLKKQGGRPKLKGQRNKLNSIPFPDPIRAPDGNYIRLPGLGKVRFHRQDLPDGKIKCGRLVKRASGWYLCVFIDAAPKAIERTGVGEIGIDPGFKDLLALSTGEKIDHPRELEASARRLAQAQRGKDKKLASRLHERIGNQRKDRNHKLSRRLVAENVVIVFSKDNNKAIAKKFGKSVASSGHAQLRSMLAYKSHIGGTRYIEVASRNSTRTCSNCGSLSGPTGLSGLAVRQWACGCGAIHDRDINAARNALIAGAGTALESGGLRHVA